MGDNSDERRKAARYQVWFPLRIHAADGEGLAINYDASERGLLIASAAHLPVGSTLKVTFQMPPGGGEERTMAGKVVRTEENASDPDGLWPHRMAVEFEEEIPNLDSVLRAALESEESEGD